MKNKLASHICYLLLLIPFILASEAHATIYKCVSANADVYYNDKPCPVNNEESEIKPVKDPVGGYIPPEFKVAEKENNAKKGFKKNGSVNLDTQKTDKTKLQSTNKSGLSNSPNNERNVENKDITKNNENGFSVDTPKERKTTELIFH